MRILLVGSMSRRFGTQNFRWHAYTAQALKRLGHAVVPLVDRESWANSQTVAQRVGRLLGVAGAMASYERARRHQRDVRLVALARRTRPDLVLVLKGETWPAEVLAQVKRLARGPLVTWWVDDPWRCPDFLPSMALFDDVFIFDRSYTTRLQAVGVQRVHFLPCACDETVYRPMTLSPFERRRFGSEIAFVAWYLPERGPVVRTLTASGLQVAIWGGQWDAPEARRALDGALSLRGPAVNDRTAAKIYNACRLGLNVHHRQSRLGGLNTRTFELLAAGVVPLVDYVEGMEGLLEPEAEVACYRSPEEACRLAKRYLADPSARNQMASRGRERVLAEHTYVHRLRRLCELSRR